MTKDWREEARAAMSDLRCPVTNRLLVYNQPDETICQCDTHEAWRAVADALARAADVDAKLLCAQSHPVYCECWKQRTAEPRAGVEGAFRVVQRTDAVWLEFGNAMVNLDAVMKERGPIVRAAYRDAVAALSPPPAPRPSVPHVYEAHACAGSCPYCNLCLTHECQCGEEMRT